jgi:hypothetical protein
MDEAETLYFTAWHTRAAMLRYSSKESCILSTRLFEQIAKSLLGANVIPLAVGATILNAEGLRRAEAGETFENEEGGAVGVICSHRGEKADRPGQWWGGHLVCLVNGNWLVDISADQFCFPEHGIILPGPLATPLAPMYSAEDLLNGGTASFSNPNGGSISYEGHAEDLSYRHSMDWEETMPGDRLYDYVHQTVEGLLDIYRDGPMILPRMPATVSKRTDDDATVMAFEARAFRELGYTEAELEARNQRERLRESTRALKHATAGQEDLAASVAELIPKLRQALGAVQEPGGSP